MIGIVVVSHSQALAHAAVELALEMVRGERPRIAIAAGAGVDDAGRPVVGTDAARVAEAIDEVASPEGVLVFMDLGSAVLSAGMALEFLSTTTEVRLSRAPFVEGVVAGIVLAAAGASLDDADREAAGSMSAKNEQLGGPETAGAAASAPAGIVAEVTLVNRLGLHARPAAAVVAAMGPFDADVSVVDTAAPERTVSASSLMGLMTLGAQGGAVLRLTGTGPQAAEAVETFRAMAADGFGEE
jgi:phosphotransferase system HPr (HPr) family protein